MPTELRPQPAPLPALAEEKVFAQAGLEPTEVISPAGWMPEAATGSSGYSKDGDSKTTAQLSVPWFLLVPPAVAFGKLIPHAGVWHPMEANIPTLFCH